MSRPTTPSQPRLLLVTAAVALAGCSVGPDYERPELDQPTGYRSIEDDLVSSADPNWEGLDITNIVRDPDLLNLVQEALRNNEDLQIAATRILQAEAAARIVGSQHYPSLGIGGSWSAVRASELGPTPRPSGSDPEFDYTTLSLSVPAYEVDLWGRIRRANEAARARLLATEAARQVVRQTIVTQVMILYLDLIRLDRELEITRRAMGNWKDSLELTKSREAGGVASMLDVYQAEVLVESALANEVDVQRRIAQAENELSFIVGRNPGPISRKETSYDTLDTMATNVGLPSSILLRRPDILAAEQRLIAANADIGEVRAAYFPNISLTGSFGFQSLELEDLLESPARLWQFVPSINLPIFTGGRRGAESDLAQARYEEAVINYRQTVRNAFREVSDALIAYHNYSRFRQIQERQAQSWRSATELSNARYDGGVSSYFEVLYNEQEFFASRLATILAARNENVALVQLYRALGGGVEPGFSLGD